MHVIVTECGKVIVIVMISDDSNGSESVELPLWFINHNLLITRTLPTLLQAKMKLCSNLNLKKDKIVYNKKNLCPFCSTFVEFLKISWKIFY